MKVDLSHLVKFPKESPVATTGVFFPDDKVLITGHENGLVVQWTLQNGGKPLKLYECSSKIETITCSPKKELVVGSHSGDVVVLTPGGSPTVVEPPAYGVHSRVWKSLWINENAFIVSSTYGEVKLFVRSANQWTREKLYGHSDSVFGMGKSSSGLLSTGDYVGNILVWALKDNRYTTIQKIKTQSAIEDLAWFKDDVFAAINKDGKIYLFERTADQEHNWKSVYEVKDATSFGVSVNITEDGKTVFAGTSTEVIQFDAETQQVDSIGISGTRKIFSLGDDVFVLTAYGLQHFKRRPIEVRLDLIKYKYVKVGLVGHTGVGKSTLCNFVTTGSPGDLLSTLGKRIWNWELPKEDSLEKRVILHDHGGQETVLSTFLPFLLDSDIVLILFQQNDITTFNKALQIYDALEPKIADRAKVFFVQTHIDEKMAEFNEGIIEGFIKDRKIVDNLKVCPKDGKGIGELKANVLKEISWDNARIMIQTIYANGVLQTIMALQEKNVSAISLEEFATYYEKVTGLHVAKSHLKFLLSDHSNQGTIEYNPEILDLIIFNEPEYNKLKTDIPIYVMKRNGIVTVEELRKEFKDSRFLPVIDAMYLKNRIAIENFEQRIFPELLSEKPVEVPERFAEYLKGTPTDTRFLPDQKVGNERLLEALSELKLKCVNASKCSGLFSWEENALIYYNFERTGNFFDGFFVRWDYRIGGKKKQICERLNQDFLSIVERLYGPFVEAKTGNNKKKVDLERKIVYDVAISYASEQVEYAKRVAEILESKGVFVFFDKFFETKMWGKDLADYLMKVYHQQSGYCMIFISKDYVSKAWPTYELKCAIARSIESMGEYILPIRFDDSEVPGLIPTIKYLNAKEKTPEQIADMFMEKLKE
jgi:WD40 repeat protein